MKHLKYRIESRKDKYNTENYYLDGIILKRKDNPEKKHNTTKEIRLSDTYALL